MKFAGVYNSFIEENLSKKRNTITIKKKELETIIRQNVKEDVSEEIMKLHSIILPYVSDEEQKEIESFHRKPAAKKKQLRAES